MKEVVLGSMLESSKALVSDERYISDCKVEVVTCAHFVSLKCVRAQVTEFLTAKLHTTVRRETL